MWYNSLCSKDMCLRGNILGICVMAAQQTLTLYVGVRISHPQPVLKSCRIRDSFFPRPRRSRGRGSSGWRSRAARESGDQRRRRCRLRLAKSTETEFPVARCRCGVAAAAAPGNAYDKQGLSQRDSPHFYPRCRISSMPRRGSCTLRALHRRARRCR